jgi:hypothetical protein
METPEDVKMKISIIKKELKNLKKMGYSVDVVDDTVVIVDSEEMVKEIERYDRACKSAKTMIHTERYIVAALN